MNSTIGSSPQRVLAALFLFVGLCGGVATALPAHAFLPLALKHYQAALVAEKANRLDQAEYELNQSITVDPNDPLTYIKLGNILEAQGRDERALAAYQTAAAHDAKDPTLYYSIGSLHEQLGQLPEARAAYEAALRKNGNYTFGLFPLGRVLARQGEDLKAISVYESFLTAYPNHTKAKRYLAGLYLGQHQPAKTVALLNVVKAQNPSAFNDYLLLAQAYNELKQPQQALNVLNEAKANGLSMAALSQVAATAHEALGEQQAAAQDLEMALTQDSDDVDTRLRLAQLYRTTQQPDKALAQVDQFLAVQPASINGRYVQANALLDLKRYNEAAQSLQRVAVLLPPDAPTSDRFLLDKQLAYAFQQSGQPAKAVALYETWSNRPQGLSDPDLMRNLAIAYHQQTEYGKAVGVYRTLVRQANASPTAATAEDMAGLALLKQDYSKALLTLANKQYEANDLIGSGQLFEEAATQGDGSATTQEAALLGLANVAFASGDKAKAVQIYHQVLALNPQQPVAGLAVAQMQVDSGQNLPQAIAVLQPLTQTPAVAGDAWMTLGDAYDKMGQTTQAIAAYDQARILNPKQLSAWMALGETYYGAKRLPEAEQAFTQALSLDPGNVTALYNRASIALAAQQLPKAETDFMAALALKPDLADAQYGLAVVYDRQKLPLKAMTAYEAYLQAQPAGPYAPQVRSRLAVLKKPVATTASALKPSAAKPLPASSMVVAPAMPVQPAINVPPVDPFYDMRPVGLPRIEPL